MTVKELIDELQQLPGAADFAVVEVPTFGTIEEVSISRGVVTLRPQGIVRCDDPTDERRFQTMTPKGSVS